MHLPPLIQDLSVILAVAAAVTFLFRLLRQPVVLGYIVAGIIVGPYTPPLLSVVDVASVKVWAELGVIFLMFALGLEFSFRRLARVGPSAAGTAMIQVVTMTVLGYVCGRLLGWHSMDAVFLGCMVSISSTTIIIKALEETGQKAKRFAELVFGVLIVEDLAAILMLVALSSIATQANVSGVELLIAGATLVLVVGAWLLIGMFVVPRLVRAVGKRGNDEMLLVVSLGLCLALVAVSTHFGYSAALGAFLMGSILAETREAHRIEELVIPFKDVFGAIFFVSIGMLLDPIVLVHNFSSVALISIVVIGGKLVAVSFGALATGQTPETSAQAGLSMAQIGEFSFIIATLGLSYNVIDAKVFPVIVAVSLITTFTTPYMIKAAPAVVRWLDRKMPSTIKQALGRYENWLRMRRAAKSPERAFYMRVGRWSASAIAVMTLFIISAAKVLPWSQSPALTWFATFIVAAPFIWGMIAAFPAGSVAQVISRLAAGLIVGLLSVSFLAPWIAVGFTLGLSLVMFLTMRRRIEAGYRWFETSFFTGIAKEHDHLSPWDARLVEIPVTGGSQMVGFTLLELALRERFGTSIVVIKRADEDLVAPKADERLFPGDRLLCFGTDEEIEALRAALDRKRDRDGRPRTMDAFALKRLEVGPHSPFLGHSIRDTGLRAQFDCMVVGLERDGQRVRSPNSDLKLAAGDLLWVVGETTSLQRIGVQGTR